MNNVRQLFALNTERRETLKQFYAEQAGFFMEQIANPAGGAAALSIAVTGESQVVTKLASRVSFLTEMSPSRNPQ